jgi:hypothetical protein
MVVAGTSDGGRLPQGGRQGKAFLAAGPDQHADDMVFGRGRWWTPNPGRQIHRAQHVDVVGKRRLGQECGDSIRGSVDGGDMYGRR